MTRTRKILHLIAKHGAMTVPEIAAVLGISEDLARNSIRDMWNKGYLQSRPSTYSLSPLGQSWKEHVPKQKKSQEIMATRLKAKKERRTAEKLSVTASALQNRHILQTVWR